MFGFEPDCFLKYCYTYKNDYFKVKRHLFDKSSNPTKSLTLKTCAANSHAHNYCVGKQGMLSGSCLSTISEIRSIQFSDTLNVRRGNFRIFLTK